jgi:2'-5' RNA ligase
VGVKNRACFLKRLCPPFWYKEHAPLMLGTTPEPHLTINHRDDRLGARRIEPIGWTVDEILRVESVVGKATHVAQGRWRLAIPA